MTIAVGASAQSTNPGTGNSVTQNCTTQATGSNFEIIVIWIGSPAAFGVQDSFSNSYTQIGSNFSGGGGQPGVARFICQGGAGGSAHNASITGTAFGSIPNAIVLLEMTGAAVSGQPAGSATGTNGAATSVSCGTISGLTPPAAGDLIVSVGACNDSTAALTFVDGTGGFTITQSYEVDAQALQYVVGTKVVTSSGSYSSTWTQGGNDLFSAGLMDAFNGPTSLSTAPIAWIT